MAARRTTHANSYHAKGQRVTRGSLERHKRLIAPRLEQLRGDRSQRSFARDLGVFQQNVNRYESGTTPHADFLITLALQENVSLDWLLLGKGRPRRR
jgi:transcriptional regulator with XRE-family HTH domain